MISSIVKNKVCILLFSLFLGLFSCSDKLDFDQADDFKVTPSLASSIIFIEVPEFFFNAPFSSTSYANDFAFEAFNEDLFSRRVLSGIITYEIENTTSKPLTITFEFIDETGMVPLDKEEFVIAPGATFKRESVYGPGGKSLDIIVNTANIRLTAENRGDDTSVNLPDSKIVLKSKAEFKVELKK